MPRMSDGLKSLFFHAGVVGLARVMGPAGSTMPVLRYHSVSEGATYGSPTIAVSAGLFDRQMAYLARHYTVVSLDSVIGCLEAGDPLPARAVAITFDDGYLDNCEAALPILVRHGLTATFYVASGPILGTQAFWVGWLYDAVTRSDDLDRLAKAFGTGALPPASSPGARREAAFDRVASIVDRADLRQRREILAQAAQLLPAAPPLDAPSPFMMRPEHLREMVRHGMTIGSHTVSHPILASLPEDQALAELVESKRQLEDLLQVPVDHLAYPNGPGVPINFDDAARRLARQAGYRSASTSVRGVVSPGDDRYALRRQGINERLDLPAFAFKVEEHRFRSLLRH